MLGESLRSAFVERGFHCVAVALVLAGEGRCAAVVFEVGDSGGVGSSSFDALLFFTLSGAVFATTAGLFNQPRSEDCDIPSRHANLQLHRDSSSRTSVRRVSRVHSLHSAETRV